MLEVDFHCHSVRSVCGQCTVLEMVAAAQRKGLRGIAITDHAPGLGCVAGAAFEYALSGILTFARRFPDREGAVRLFKGVEANVLDRSGRIDVPLDLAADLDLVLLAFHPYTTYPPGTAQENTEALVRALERNPYVDVIAHPCNYDLPLDVSSLAPILRDQGIAVELNNGSLASGKEPVEAVTALLSFAAREGLRVALGSDAHVVHQVGGDEAIREVLQRAGTGCRIVNETLASAESFIAERRRRRSRSRSK